ncbi:CCAAT/enhancer-binding protein zeta-like isoform X1 [Prorops nasuta]|uniref:CCAAT/enhancer-binding protein zeta-like isoform X1 n=1 Tax=Prorops nasuta TaxID=863751 RepID=UPI0034CDC1D5
MIQLHRKNDNNIDDNSGKWYDGYVKTLNPCKHSKTDNEVFDLLSEAKRYFDSESKSYHLKKSKTRDPEAAWLNTAMKQGTAADKIAASIVLIQDEPKYNISKLIALISQAKTAKRNQCNEVINALKDLFLTCLLYPNGKLIKFSEQDLDNIDAISKDNKKKPVIRNKLLAQWYFEDQLKEQYEKFVIALSSIATDTVEANREKAISIMTDLLIGNPEQEHKLLDFIVNKIGDPSSKIASKTIYCLNKLLKEHPVMNMIVLKEIEKLLFRKNMSPRAQYYAICLLTQFVLSKDDHEIAVALIDLYFAFFKACLKKGEPDSRMMTAILTGVNRAYRFANTFPINIQNHIDSVYKIVHMGSFNTALNALCLLYQITEKDDIRENRFHSAFYRKLLCPQIGIANKCAMFLNLLFRVLKRDKSILRLRAYIKRVLQIALYFPPNMACATLYVISRVIKVRKDLKVIFDQTQTSIKKEDIKLNQQRERESHNVIDVEGEITIEDKADYIDDINEPKLPASIKDSDLITNIVCNTYAETVHIKDDIKQEQDVNIEVDKKEYDPFCRNPLYSNAIKSFNFELIALVSHFHPSVSLFAKTIMLGKTIDYTGDPLEDLASIRFLDRYVFKNPKQLEEKKVQKKNDPLSRRAGYTPKGIRNLPVDSAAYLNEREDHIPVDELFLYKFLKKKQETGVTNDKREDDDNDSVNSEEFNEMLDKMNNLDDLENLDIAADIRTVKNIKKGDKEEDEDEDNDNHDEDEDANMESDDLLDVNDDDKGLQDLSDIDLDDIEDDDLSDMEFNDDEDEDDESNAMLVKIKNKKVKDTHTSENIFVSAEKFAEMLENNYGKNYNLGSSNEFSAADGADRRQINWETQRNFRLQGIKRSQTQKFSVKCGKKRKRY